MLATPGLDRHAAYVALSRHRHTVELHYGRGDFANQAKLVRTLSRERAKDMASDYTRSFAEWREIRLPEPKVRPVPPRLERDPFAELGEALARHAPALAPDPFVGLTLRIDKSGPEEETARKLSEAVQRFARAAVDIVRLRNAGREPLPYHMEAFHKAGAGLDQVRPGGGRDMASAYRRDPSIIDDAAKGRTTNAIRQMVLETEMRTDPERRAERFMEDWRKLSREREAHRFNYDEAGVRRAEAGMAAMGKQLQRDPQLESLLRPRTRELGIESGSGGSLSHTIQDWLDRSRRRDIGL